MAYGHRWRALLACITVALAAAACSGSDAADTTPATAAAPRSTVVTSDVVDPTGTDPTGTEPTDTEPTGTEPATTEPLDTEPADDLPRYTTLGSEVLFDDDALHTFQLDLAPEDLAFLDADPAAEEYVPGTLTFDGETLAPIGVRYKGSVGSFLGCTVSPNPFEPTGPKSCTKLSLKLKFNWEDPDTTFYGERRINLQALNLDTSLLHERLGYWLFREMGVPAPRSTHARVVVNGEYLGVFALTEEVDGRFTRDRFDDGTGNLYKEIWPFDAAGAPHRDADYLAALETNEDDDPTVDIIGGFAAEVAAAAPDDRLDVIDDWLDVDLLLRTLVVDRSIGNDDGPLHWYCLPTCAPHNFFWYEDPSERSLTLVPWDLDNAFDALLPGTNVGSFIGIADPLGRITSDCQPFPFGGFNLPQRSAACDPLIGTIAALTEEFDTIRAELLAGPMSVESIADQLGKWTAQIEPAVAEAAALHGDAPTVDAWQAAVQQLETAIQTSREGTGR